MNLLLFVGGLITLVRGAKLPVLAASRVPDLLRRPVAHR